jgi:hypothetical protein
VPHARRELGGQFFGMLEDAPRLAQAVALRRGPEPLVTPALGNWVGER